jgi:glycosyltransferase involved in cell wall biosynthesis
MGNHCHDRVKMPTRYIGRDLRVLLVTGDAGACAFYRMELPAAMCAQENLPVEISTGLPGKEGKDGLEIDYDKVRESYDVVVIQRPLLQVIAESIPILQQNGVTVIVEVDDDFTAVHKDNQAYWRTHPDNEKTPYNRDYVEYACKVADHVIVTTPALYAVYGRHGRASIIPNFVPSFLLDWRFIKYTRCCGWSGSISTHPRDLQTVGNGVSLAVEEARSRFLVIGLAEKVQEALRLTNPVIETGWLPVQDYYKELGRLEVGIVPLEESRFNHAKSNLKGLEYAATGVPFVASPLPEYRRLSEKGAGIIAKRPREWFHELMYLLSSEERRKERAERGREAIRENYLLENNWHLWPEAWERAWRDRHA